MLSIRSDTDDVFRCCWKTCFHTFELHKSPRFTANKPLQQLPQLKVVLTIIFTSVMLDMFTFYMGTKFLFWVAVVQLLI